MKLRSLILQYKAKYYFFKKKLKKATVKAMSKMRVRKVNSDDKELAESCAICLENFAVNDQLRELPCKYV